MVKPLANKSLYNVNGSVLLLLVLSVFLLSVYIILMIVNKAIDKFGILVRTFLVENIFEINGKVVYF